MPEAEDIQFMRLAIRQAKIGRDLKGGGEVGAVLVKNSVVRCRGYNEAKRNNDPTAHAEMVVIRRLCFKNESMSLEGHTLYCTLQPCGMCTMAALWAGVSRIVYGAGRGDVHAVYFESRHSNTFDFIQDAFRSDLAITGGVLSQECATLYAAKDADVPLDSDLAHGQTKWPT